MILNNSSVTQMRFIVSKKMLTDLGLLIYYTYNNKVRTLHIIIMILFIQTPQMYMFTPRLYFTENMEMVSRLLYHQVVVFHNIYHILKNPNVIKVWFIILSTIRKDLVILICQTDETKIITLHNILLLLWIKT